MGGRRRGIYTRPWTVLIRLMDSPFSLPVTTHLGFYSGFRGLPALDSVVLVPRMGVSIFWGTDMNLTWSWSPPGSRSTLGVLRLCQVHSQVEGEPAISGFERLRLRGLVILHDAEAVVVGVEVHDLVVAQPELLLGS